MSTEFPVVSLITLGNGAAVERFNMEFQKVIENIQDPNCDPEFVREITLTVKVCPNKTGQRAVITVESKAKLAPYYPHETAVHFGMKDGELMAVEFNPQQANLPGIGPDQGTVMPMPPRLRQRPATDQQ